MNLHRTLASALLFSVALAAGAADLADAVKQRGTLKIALEGTYPPFNYKENGQLAGFEVELANALAQKMGVKAEFTTSEWSAILAGLQAGKYDVVINQVLFRFDDDETTLRVLDEVQRGGEAWMGGTTWEGRAAIRIAVSSWRTTESDIDRTVAAFEGALVTA